MKEDLSWYKEALIDMTGIVPSDEEVEEFAKDFENNIKC